MKMSVWSLACQKTYFSDITVKNIYQSFTHKMSAKASWHRNYVTVTSCIRSVRLTIFNPFHGGQLCPVRIMWKVGKYVWSKCLNDMWTGSFLWCLVCKWTWRKVIETRAAFKKSIWFYVLTFFRFLNFIFCKALLAYLRCRQYVRNSAATLTTHTLTKLLI